MTRAVSIAELGIDPLISHDNTWLYYDFSDADNTGTYASWSSNLLTSVATGASSQTLTTNDKTLPKSTGSISTESGYRKLALSQELGMHRDLSSVNLFSPSTYGGLTMGCLIKNDAQTHNTGVIGYGNTQSGGHFYVRFNFNATGTADIGEDSDGTDAWVQCDKHLVSDTWYFMVFIQYPNGNLAFSRNGKNMDNFRAFGAAVLPSSTTSVSLGGDDYGGNQASDHHYLTAFWYKGTLTQAQINYEYQHLRKKFPSLSF